MNYLRKIYPLWFREKLYFHSVLRDRLWPKDFEEGVLLELAPVKMTSLLHTDYAHRQIAWCGFYELALSRKIAMLAHQGGLLVDVGANAGYFSCIWAGLNTGNEVYAFEPSPRNLPMLRQNISTLENPQRVRVFDYALSKQKGKLNFDLGPEDQSGWGGLVNTASARTIKVKVGRLDDIIPEDKNISVLKIDTEGADTWVLYGAKKLLREQRVQHIFFEANDERMQQLGIRSLEAENYLMELGYKISPFGAQELYSTRMSTFSTSSHSI